MVTTFAAFCAVIQSEINDNTSEMLARIESWVNDAHFSICNERDWSFLEKISNKITLTSANTPYDYATLAVGAPAVNTPCRKILDVMDVDYSPEKPLIQITAAQLRASGVDYSGYTSLPEYWMIQASKLKVFPGLDTTGRGYTIRFVQDATTYEAGSTTALLIPDRHIAVLKAATLYRAWSWLGDARATMRLAEYQQLFAAMKANDTGLVPAIYASTGPANTRIPRLVTGV